MEKTFKSIIANYKPKKVKRIIKEEKQEKTIKNEATKKQNKKEKIEESVELDDIEQTFISKYIEYSQLSLLNKSAAELTATFEKSLGPNAQAAIKQLMNKTSQRETKINNLAKQLTSLKDQMIKETEKARAKETLIDLASSISVPEKKSKPQLNKSKNKNVNVAVNNPEDFARTTDFDQVQDVASTINVVESKKKTKKK